jgi:hypothetical protein
VQEIEGISALLPTRRRFRPQRPPRIVKLVIDHLDVHECDDEPEDEPER